MRAAWIFDNIRYRLSGAKVYNRGAEGTERFAIEGARGRHPNAPNAPNADPTEDLFLHKLVFEIEAGTIDGIDGLADSQATLEQI